MSDQETNPSDPRWRRQPEERPQQILDAAVEVFAEHGIAAAKLEEIAARAGVSKGTIYLYFPSKEDLFRAVVRQTVVPRLIQADEILAHGTATNRLEGYLRHHWETMNRDDSEGWVRLTLCELHKYPDLAEFYRTEVIARSNRLLGDIILQGVESGEFRAIDPDVAVMMIKAIIVMHVVWRGKRSHSPGLRATPRALTLQHITDFILHALRTGTAIDPDAAAHAGVPTT